MPNGQCKLCLEDKNLQDSHLQPSAFYKMALDRKRKPPDPIVITSRTIRLYSKQVRDYVFCRDCEQLFNNNGERWVIQQVYNGEAFPLLDRLRLALPISPMYSSQPPVYSGTAVGIDTGKLAYFALSVLYKASVHQWKIPDGQTISISLGVYEEPIRNFLLGKTAFPADVAVAVEVCTDSISQESFFAPSLVPQNLFTTYNFLARGIDFTVFVGSNLPPEVRKCCCFTGAKTLIFTRSRAHTTSDAFVHLMETSKPSGSLRIR